MWSLRPCRTVVCTSGRVQAVYGVPGRPLYSGDPVAVCLNGWAARSNYVDAGTFIECPPKNGSVMGAR